MCSVENTSQKYTDIMEDKPNNHSDFVVSEADPNKWMVEK